jgi:hypothetical protein
MTWADFKRKWSRFKGKESSAYQEHFNDLCRLLGEKTPIEADPSGSDFFCFQKRVVKDMELMVLKENGAPYGDDEERGFADVWKKDCFAWEYKGKKKNLDEAYQQLLRYRESLLNPPLLVVCDFDRYIVRTNFNGTVQQTFEFTNADIDAPRNITLLRALFSQPERLQPQRTTKKVTEDLADKIAAVARSLQSRESVELADARSRKEVKVAEKHNLRIARFLNRIIFCFFAEDVELLPKGIFTEIATAGLDDPHFFAERLEALFRVMAKGGTFGAKKIRHFNGHLFEEATVFELTMDEIRTLADASEAEWQFIEPSIMGTLFERALDDSQRAKLGAHYTSETDIKTLVEPVLMQPLRREWTEIKRELLRSYSKGKGTAADRAVMEKFHRKISTLAVLDPACGSGNFLYVSLQLLLALEKELLAFATQLGFGAAEVGTDRRAVRSEKSKRGAPSGRALPFRQSVGVHQLKAIEINPYAFELAQVSVQIGYLQWMRDNGFPLDRSPVLQVLDGFQNEDALLVPHYRSKAKTLKEARGKEHEKENALKFYTERDWPECDVIVGNPPFLGGKLLRREIGDEYISELFKVFSHRVLPESDLCCYWHEKARELIEKKQCKRAGLLATQGIRGGASREVLKRIKETGDIFFAESDRPWVLDGANVHVSMVGFDNGSEKTRTLDGKSVSNINSNLSSIAADVTQAKVLIENAKLAFMGTTKQGPFDIPEELAIKWAASPNPNQRPTSDVLFPWINGEAITKRVAPMWIVDFFNMTEADAAKFETPFAYVSEHVKKMRDENPRDWYRSEWWQLYAQRPEMRSAFRGLSRYIITPRVSKYRLFVWAEPPALPDSATIVFTRDDDYFFGVLQSHFHEVWALKLGTRLETRPRYTPTTCFETFPLPRPTPAQETAIAAAAKELNELRERWLNPPEWTRQEILEFPATANGPWARYISGSARASRAATDAPSVASEKISTGASKSTREGACAPQTARYPRLVPKDADCAKKLKERTLTNLYNQRPAWLDLAHKKLDAAVADAYGFPADLTDEQILERLLKLNQSRAAEELKSGKTKPARMNREKTAEEMI